MSFLMIQNRGEAPVEAFSLLGASSSRGTDKIGQFGTGTKHSINLLLRERVDFRIYSGSNKIEFGTEATDFKGQTVVKVTFKTNGRKSRDTGWTLDWGSMDWNNVAMALREFVSNAIDDSDDWQAAIKSGDLKVEVVKEARAKAGYTRVFVELTPEVQRFYGELPFWFLHFSSPDLVNQVILPKLEPNTPARVYRRGVFVRQMPRTYRPSKFDYNSDNIDLDDCRNSTISSCATAIGKAVAAASVSTKTEILSAILNEEVIYESELHEWDLSGAWQPYESECKQTWKDAWETCGGGVAVEPLSPIVEHVARKGHKPVQVKSGSVLGALERAGVQTASKVIGSGPLLELAPVTEEARRAMAEEWNRLNDLGLTNGKKRPGLSCFSSITNGEVSLMGIYKDETVFIHTDVAQSPGPVLNKTVFEELVHHVTGSGDCTRDFQNLLIDAYFAGRQS